MERNVSIDIIKGFLILLVILGHAISLVYGEMCSENVIFMIIYSFHMPLFVFISGYLFFNSLNKNFKDVLRKKIQRLIIPLLIASTVLVIINISSKSNFMAVDSSWNTIVLGLYRIYTTYWFLICVFALSLIAHMYYHVGYKLKIGMLLLWLFLWLIYEKLPFYPLKNCQILRMSLIFVIGVIMGKMVTSQNDIKRSKILLINLFFISLVGIGGFVRLYGYDYFSYPLFFRSVFGLFCSVISMFFLQILLRCMKKTPKIEGVFAYVGKKSLELYILHILMMKILQWNNIYIKKSFFMTMMLFLMYVIWSIGVIYIYEYVKKKIMKVQ